MRPNNKLLQAELIKDTEKYKEFRNAPTKISPTSDSETLFAEINKIPVTCDMTLPFIYIVCVVRV